MDCERTEKIHALYDAALSGPECAELQLHAAGCAACRRELDELRRVGRFLQVGAPPIASIGQLSGLRARLKSRRLARLYEPRVIGLAKWLTSAAAAVMLACGAALMSMPARPMAVPAALNTSGWDAWAVAANDDTSVDPLTPLDDIGGKER